MAGAGGRGASHDTSGGTGSAATRWSALPLALLVALLAVHATVNAVWLATDPDPPVNHHSSEQTALAHYLVLKGYPPVETHGHKPTYVAPLPQGPGRGRGNLEPLLQPFRFGTDPGWIPLSLFHLFSVLLACLFGLSYTSLTMAGTIFFSITVLSVFSLVRRLRGAWAGLLAALIVSSYPFVFGCPRQYFIYQSTASMTVLAVALLVHSDRLRRPWIVACAALSISVGMRAGESGTETTLLLMSLVGPLAVALWLALPRPWGIRAGRFDLRLRGVILLLALLLPTMGLRWYLGEFVVKTLSWNLQAGGSSTKALAISPPRGTLEFYSLHLLEVGLVQIRSIPLLIIAVLGIGLLVWRWKRPLSWTLLSWIAVPAIILSVMTQKNVWYLSSILPALAVASALLIVAIPGRARSIVAVVVACCCVYQVVWMTAFPGASQSNWRSAHRQRMNLGLYSYVPMRHDGPFTQTAWAVRAISARIDELDPERTGELTVGLVMLGDAVSSCRIEALLKMDRPQMLTATLQEPRTLLRGDDFDVIAYVGQEGTTLGSRGELITHLERSLRHRLQRGCPGALDMDDAEVRELSRRAGGWLTELGSGPYRAEFEGSVGMLLRDRGDHAVRLTE